MRTSLLVLSCVALLGAPAFGAQPLGPFDDHQDVGTPSKTGPGSATWDAGAKTLKVTGGGANVWAKEDDMQFVWKKMSAADMTFSADIDFDKPTTGAIEHRKAMLMIRQNLDKDSPYADACLHGNGMSALQWRDGKGDISYEIEANATMPRRFRIEKRGNYFSMSIGGSDADMKPSGGACKVELTGDYYVGIGVCSHSTDRLETATFSNIDFGTPPAGTTKMMVSTLNVYLDTGNRDRRVVLVETHPNGQRLEAPNWLPDDTKTLMYNFGGKLWKVPAILPSNDGTNIAVTPAPVDIGTLRSLNNDHVLSFDGKMLAVSGGAGGSSVYTLPMGATNPTPLKVTTATPSYVHGWSPDGKTLVFAAPRNPNSNSGNWDIYSIPAAGGTETRLTSDAAREDGPEFSPDGKYIYFNSARTGSMEIWRMKPDGSDQEQLTKDGLNSWFPHISPNSQKIVFISYGKDVKPDDHDSITDVQIRLMNISSGQITTIAKIYGGQGTINVPSWSPDSRAFAFMSYQPIQQPAP